MVGVLLSIVVWIFVAPLLALIVHEFAHAVVVARATGRRTAVVLGRGPRLTTFSIGLIDAELRLVPIRDGCTVDLSGVPIRVARTALRAGPIADLAQMAACLLLSAVTPVGVATALAGMALQYAWWGITGLRSRSGLRFAEPYESDGYKIGQLSQRALHGVIAAEPGAGVDPLLAFIAKEAPQLVALPGAAGPPVAPAAARRGPAAAGDPLLAYLHQTAPELVGGAPASTPPMPVVVAPVPPRPVASSADPLLAYLQENAPELVTAPAAAAPRPPARPRVDPRAATSIAPPGMR